MLTVGTKSVLFGIHAFWLHWWFVRRAWGILYPQFPPTLVEWCAILTHDLGYWGCFAMDDEVGQTHPERISRLWRRCCGDFGKEVSTIIIGHSRFYAQRNSVPLSRLYAPDKLASSLYPLSLYTLLGRLSGELPEYISRFRSDHYGESRSVGMTDEQVVLEIQSHLVSLALDSKGVKRDKPGKYPWPIW